MSEGWKLIIKDPQGRSKKMNLSVGAFKLGHGKNCKIRLPASYEKLAEEHLLIEVTADGVSIQDLGGGVEFNGKKIETRAMKEGDEVSLGGGLSLQLAGADAPVPTNAPVSVNKPSSGGPNVASHESPAYGSSGNMPSATASAPMPELIGSMKDEIQHITKATSALMEQMARRIVGQEDILRAVWACILAKGHCLLIGVPGLAKTYMVNAFSEALGLDFNRIQFTPDLMPSDIIGSTIIEEGTDGRRQFKFVEGPVFTQLLLADEINRTPPKTQAALLEAMQEGQVTVGDATRKLPKPFTVVAAQNPLDQDGTYPLPEAQQDRFMMCLVLDYPGRNDEIDIALRTTQGIEPVIDRVLSPEMILRFQAVVNRIAVSREAAEVAVDLVRSTRSGAKGVPDYVVDLVEFGAGPRAVQSLLRAAKAYAAMDGRPAVTASDIRDLALPVLRHRIRCNYRARAEKMNEDKVIQRLVKELKKT